MTKNSGPNSTVAGGNISSGNTEVHHNYIIKIDNLYIRHDDGTEEAITRFDDLYSKVLEPKFEEYDLSFQTLIPDGLINKRHQPKPFRAERLFSSLHNLGIPLKAIFFVLEKLTQKIAIVWDKTQPFSSTDLTKVVSKLLYSYDAADIDQTKKDLWGDLYIRVYGDPERQVMVVFHDGPRELSAGLFKQRIYPNLLEDIADKNLPIVEMGINRQQKQTIVNECLRQINRLQLYRIHISTVIKVCSEIALQPPHPWFVAMPKSKEAIQYDFVEKATAHKEALWSNYESGEIEAAFSDFNELVHHSSSAFLAYFGIYMGCGYRAPLFTLERVLRKIQSPEQSFHVEIQQSVAEHVVSHLRKSDVNLTDFHRLTQSLVNSTSLTTRSDKTSIMEAFRDSMKLYNYTENCLKQFLVYTQINVDGIGTQTELWRAVDSVFSMIHGIRLERNESKSWIKIESKEGVLGRVGPRIAFSASYDEKNLKFDFKNLLESVTKPLLTNAVFLLSNYKIDKYTLNELHNTAQQKELHLFHSTLRNLWLNVQGENSTDVIFSEALIEIRH